MTTTESQHRSLVASLKKDPIMIWDTITVHEVDANHMALGIAGEAGEIVDVIKRHTMYNQPLDKANLIEELGDMEFYLEGLRTLFHITREEVLTHNIAKLSKRYAAGYTDAAAKTRADKL